VSLRAGLAVADALDRVGIEPPIGLKWPNDLMLGDRKTGGLLCEARWQGAAPAWVVIGLGLNVANPPPAPLAATATYLGASRPGLVPAELVEPIVRALREVDAASGPLTPAEQTRFAQRDWLRARTIDGPVRGIVEGLGPDGALRVRSFDGRIVEVRAGSVVLGGRGATPLPG
jgi:BirA family biotin operon repressor/biotin-[acetyl-CoA-carboxylase] ligase